MSNNSSADKIRKIVNALNGDRFIKNDSGEADVRMPDYYVHLPGDDATPDQVICALADTVDELKVKYSWSPQIANFVLGGRAGAFFQGLLRPDAAAGTHNCRRKEVYRLSDSNALSDAGRELLADWESKHRLPKKPSPVQAPKKSDSKAREEYEAYLRAAQEYREAVADWNRRRDAERTRLAQTHGAGPSSSGSLPEWVDGETIEFLISNSANLICLVAWVFRTRGHHFQVGFDESYDQKFRKLMNVAHGKFPRDMWQYYATYGVHAIYPDDLDAFWTERALAGEISNALILRHSAPCAGTAQYFALHAGLEEWRMIAGKAADKHAAAIRALEDLVEYLSEDEHRWVGGINHGYYGQGVIPSQYLAHDFAALSAAVYGVNTAEGDETPLGRSEALRRTANSAPLSQRLWRSMAEGMYRAMNSGATRDKLGNRALEHVDLE